MNRLNNVTPKQWGIMNKQQRSQVMKQDQTKGLKPMTEEKLFMDRKLVTIREVKKLIPIEGADFIELAQVDGWQCIVKKGDFEVGDSGIYFEIDSCLPMDDPRFEFLHGRCKAKHNDGDCVLRIKTIKMKGVLSQGLLMPIDEFKNELNEINDLIKYGSSNDYSPRLQELLRVKLYEPYVAANLRGQVEGSFPSFIPKTDQNRIQNLPDYFEKYKDISFEVTCKHDGISFTCYKKDDKKGVCSRNWDLKETESNLYWNIYHKYNLGDILDIYGKNIAIQGEIIGEGIKSNREEAPERMLLVFNIYDIDEQKFYNPIERTKFCEEYNLTRVAQILGDTRVSDYRGRYVFRDHPTIESILEFSDGTSMFSGLREGIVCKSMDGTIQFKVISNKYLLHYGL